MTYQPIAFGGTIFSLAAAHGTLWLASESGLWRGWPGAWLPLDAPLTATTALLALPTTQPEHAPLLLVGDQAGSIIRSVDGGATWSTTHTDATDSPITCLAASPRFAEDRVLLAGTLGSGILRSTDGGRFWRRTNAGLREFDVLTLATAPTWGEREVVFAITSGGLYRSPNGGRYWKRVADAGDALPLQALAVNPSFDQNGTAYAAGELAGLVRSTDGGRMWQCVEVDELRDVNCLWSHPNDPQILIAGTLDGALLRSTDGGTRWTRATEGHGAVLALAAEADTLYAAVYDQGLLVSTDGGAIWQLDESIAVRDIARLAAGQAGDLLAYGPTDGLWRKAAAGWQRLPLPDDALPVLALLDMPDGRALLGSTERVLVLTPEGTVAHAAALPGAVTTLALVGEQAWLGTSAGELWRSVDGQRWEHVATVAAGQLVVALAALGGQALTTATYNDATRTLTLWRSDDAGRRWERWLEQPTGWPRSSLCAGAMIWAAIGEHVWRWDGVVWQAIALDGTPAVTLRGLPDGGVVAGTSAGIYRCTDGASWARVDVALPPGGLLDLVATPAGELILLGRGGHVGAQRLAKLPC